MTPESKPSARKYVIKTFFITKEEAERLCDETGNPYIVHIAPCYELEDGQMLYPHGGASDFAIEITYAPLAFPSLP